MMEVMKGRKRQTKGEKMSKRAVPDWSGFFMSRTTALKKRRRAAIKATAF